MRSSDRAASRKASSWSLWRSLLGGCLRGGAGGGAGDSRKNKVRPGGGGGAGQQLRRLSFTDLSGAADQDLSVSLVGSNLHVFTVAELRAATRGFVRGNFLGEGGFGPVYKGFVDDGVKPGLKAQAIAVKLWDPEGAQGHKEWLAEVIFLGQLRHPNLVKLVGYCCEEEHRLLVYEYMAHGSLENHLFKQIPSVLPWSTRLNIAVGAAKGLAFLHDAEKPVIYRDFKASNILLDSGSILGAEVTVARRSYSTQVIEVEDHTAENIGKGDRGGLLKPQLFCLTIPQIDGGADICATIRWSQKLHYDNGRFSVDIPFRFPYYVNPLPKVFMKREKIQLTVNSGFSKEVLLQGTSHLLKEKGRQGEKLSFLHEAVVENWSSKDFTFSYSVYSGDLAGGVLVQPSTLRDYDDRDRFCVFLLPGIGNRKVFRKAVVFVVDTSGSMRGKPLENVKNAVSTALSELMQGDYFNIITFNDELHSFSSCLEKVNEEAIASAIDWMDSNFVAEGGTDIMHPLSEAMALLSSVHDALPQIFLMTDGSVDDEHNICQTMKTELINRGSKSPRISTFGLGSYCNHYFLRMLASIGKGHYDAVLETGSIESRILGWFRKASSTIVANISIDAMEHLDEFEVDSEYIPDISAKCPLCVSGKYQGKFPQTVTAKGYLADMTEISIELKVQHIKDIPLDKVLAAQQIDLLTAKAWLSADKQQQRKVMKLSIQNSIPSEYTSMVLLQTNQENVDAAQKVKQKLKGHNGPDVPLRTPLRGIKLGFGDRAATRENRTTGFGDARPPETFVILNKAAGCCSRLADCLCCMCCIKACNRMNDQCAIVLAQVCAALSCLGCYECCAELCCGGTES